MALEISVVLIFVLLPIVYCSVIIVDQEENGLTQCEWQGDGYINCQPKQITKVEIDEPVKEVYYVSDLMKANWYKALRFCLERGSTLATVKSQEDHDRLARLMESHGINRLWIGATDKAEKGKFFWMSDGSDLKFTSWLRGEPNNNQGIEDCVEIWKKEDNEIGWNDLPCSTMELNFACDLP